MRGTGECYPGLGEGGLAGQSQRMATAIEAGLANRVCGIDEIIGLLTTPEREPAA
jgi:hypothetical protein